MTDRDREDRLGVASDAQASAPSELLGASELVRELIDALVRVDAASPAGDALAQHLRRALVVVREHVLTPAELFGEHALGRTADYLDRSPVTGRLNPLAPPVTLSIADDGVASARLSLGMAYQGPPARVHGGVVATLLDHVMGYAAGTAGMWSFTRSLTVDYDRAVPLITDIDIRAWVERVEGRKVFVRGDISADGETLVRANGLWLPARQAV